MNKKWVISITVTALIWIVGITIFVLLKKDVEKRLYEAPMVLNVIENENNPNKDLKDILHDTKKRVVMVELSDGSVGSGFLFNDKGDIITNAHVVQGAKKVKVRTTDAKGFDGEVIGISLNTDVALVRVDGLAGQEPLKLDLNHTFELGDEVVALGSPLGLQNTVTTGIISGTGREFDLAPYHYEDAYQISAPIAPGNSGGPLLDRKTGKVIGINSARMEEGTIGFSLSIKNVYPLVKKWSDTPMKSLPNISALDEFEKIDENKMSETADYLISYFMESIDHQDYVTAYSLLSSTLQSNTDYESFRNRYISIASLKIEELSSEKKEDHILAKASLQTEEVEKGNRIKKNYDITYKVIFENEQAKIDDIKMKAKENK
ncbi:trypsin-like peptidase domain-containing protein [Metabacillus arenae]|uniref:Trypsin-like peptidase domain-containing protein n=1 Tax=Metabacillus arenae TaxID=2771434 RepID=A0A926S230_9BACI|nr:trypsin-like peptidase domain-containing protein [Metabacillus arenae]MBD1381589.1 trypsin-like peptidase domain-containing protein [Metabacillus arenae]